jgi:large subunit ribosomal protein L10
MSLRPSLQGLIPTLSRCASTSAARQPTTPQTIPGQDRIYTDRKTYLYDYYTHLLRTSQLVLLFQHDNLSVSDLQKIRQGIAKIKPPPSPSPTNGNTETTIPVETRASLTILRTGILSALTRHQSIPFPKLKGQTALISSPTLAPKYMSQILTAIQRTIKKNQREGSKDQVIKQPELKLLFGYMEGTRFVEAGQVEQIGKLRDLDGQRSELVGLLEMRGRELVGVLGQAGGGGLVRTLQGLEKGLKEQEEGSQASA